MEKRQIVFGIVFWGVVAGGLVSATYALERHLPDPATIQQALGQQQEAVSRDGTEKNGDGTSKNDDRTTGTIDSVLGEEGNHSNAYAEQECSAAQGSEAQAHDLLVRESSEYENGHLQFGEIRTEFIVANRSYEIWVGEDTTVRQAMEFLEEYTDFSFSGRYFLGIDFFVDEINGLREDPRNGKFWIYYINNQPAAVGISQYILNQDDIITWQYEDEK